MCTLGCCRGWRTAQEGKEKAKHNRQRMGLTAWHCCAAGDGAAKVLQIEVKGLTNTCVSAGASAEVQLTKEVKQLLGNLRKPCDGRTRGTFPTHSSW